MCGADWGCWLLTWLVAPPGNHCRTTLGSGSPTSRCAACRVSAADACMHACMPWAALPGLQLRAGFDGEQSCGARCASLLLTSATPPCTPCSAHHPDQCGLPAGHLPVPAGQRHQHGAGPTPRDRESCRKRQLSAQWRVGWRCIADLSHVAVLLPDRHLLLPICAATCCTCRWCCSPPALEPPSSSGRWEGPAQGRTSRPCRWVGTRMHNRLGTAVALSYAHALPVFPHTHAHHNKLVHIVCHR